MPTGSPLFVATSWSAAHLLYVYLMCLKVLESTWVGKVKRILSRLQLRTSQCIPSRCHILQLSLPPCFLSIICFPICQRTESSVFTSFVYSMLRKCALSRTWQEAKCHCLLFLYRSHLIMEEKWHFCHDNKINQRNTARNHAPLTSNN